MCLCKIVVFTFSNLHAFKRLEYKLEKYGKYPPIGTIYYVNRNIKKRDRKAYEEMLALAELHRMPHTHFEGWARFKTLTKEIISSDQDIFGIIRLKIV